MSALRNTRFKVVSVFVGLLLGLTTTEVATRVFSLATPLNLIFSNYVADPNLPFRPRPFSRGTGRNDEFSYDYQHNSFGFRDVEHEIAKAPGTFRLLGLGDSFTYGIGASLRETYLSRLEVLLNHRAGVHPKIEVIKAGVPRYFPQAERILLENDGVKFRPDVVVVGILPNDLIDTYLGIDAVTADRSGYLKTREAKELGEAGVLVYRHSHVGRLLLRAYIDWRLVVRSRGLLRQGRFPEKEWEKMESEFAHMTALVDSIGAKLVLVHIPQKGPWTVEDEHLPTRLAAWAAKNRVSFVDLLPAMKSSPAPDQLYYAKDGHCTPEGYAVIAQTIFSYLTENRIIP